MAMKAGRLSSSAARRNTGLEGSSAQRYAVEDEPDKNSGPTSMYGNNEGGSGKSLKSSFSKKQGSRPNSMDGGGTGRTGGSFTKNGRVVPRPGNSVGSSVLRQQEQLTEWKNENERNRRISFNGSESSAQGGDKANHEIAAEGLLQSGQSVAQGKVLNPRSTLMRRWDMSVASLLIFVAIVTPYDVAFLEPRINFLFFVNRLVDLVFLTDLLMQFSLSYYDERTNQWIYDRKRIMFRYVTGWFLVDLASVFPFDALGMMIEDDNVESLKGLRIVRLARLAKLLRILRAGRIFRRLETAWSIDYTQLEIMKFGFMTLMFAHWMACGWRLVVEVDGTTHKDDDNWMQKAFPNMDGQPLNESSMQLYMASLYFSISHMTIGYGTIVPETYLERFYSMCCMLFGAFVFGYIIGSVASVIAARDVKQNRYYHMMKELNSFMREGKFPPVLQSKLREYFRYVNTADSVSNYTHLLRFMSPKLRGEVARLMDNNWIDKVTLFRATPNAFKIQVALSLEQQTYPPAEPIFEVGDPNDRLYLVKKGVIAMSGGIFVAGMVFCEESIFREDLLHWVSAHTMAFSVIFSLKREDIMDIVGSFPEVLTRFRKISIRRVFREEIWAYCNAYKRYHDEPPIKNRRNFLGMGPVIDARQAHYLGRLRYELSKEDDKALLEKSAIHIQRRFRQHLRDKGWEMDMEHPGQTRMHRSHSVVVRDERVEGELNDLVESVADLRGEMGALQRDVGDVLAVLAEVLASVNGLKGQIARGGAGGGAFGAGRADLPPALEPAPLGSPLHGRRRVSGAGRTLEEGEAPGGSFDNNPTTGGGVTAVAVNEAKLPRSV